VWGSECYLCGWEIQDGAKVGITRTHARARTHTHTHTRTHTQGTHTQSLCERECVQPRA
jgi:hypothetical protein